MLKRYGAKWAVLTAMTADMAGKGIKLPQDVFESLRRVRSDLESGCFSTCGVSCDLSQAEGPIFSQCHLLDPQEFQAWSDLLAEAMSGKLTTSVCWASRPSITSERLRVSPLRVFILAMRPRGSIREAIVHPTSANTVKSTGS